MNLSPKEGTNTFDAPKNGPAKLFRSFYESENALNFTNYVTVNKSV
jgi:hypothetical protein